jgi:radical SAM superfamily enzyme YgiQ (UPF0313 family)
MKDKMIILFHPATHHEKFYSSYWIPYSLLSIASMVTEDYEVILLDENLNANDNIDFSKITTNCLCVGISSMTGHQITGGLEFAKKIKKTNPEIPIIWGGPHATILPDSTIRHPLVDIVVRGQGEYAFKEIVKRLDQQKTLKGISNVVYKQGNTVVNNGVCFFRSKKSLPEFPWHLIDIKKYIRCDDKIGTRILNYVSSQGCPFQCAFCTETALYKGKWKSYGLKRIIKDITYLVNNEGINAIKFYDAIFFVNIPIAIRFAKYLIDTHLNINWAASGHPKILNALKENQWQLLSESKCKRLLIGAESGSQDVLNYIKKGITPDLIIELAKKCKDFGIVGSFTFIVGFPNCKDDNEIEKTIALGLKIRDINTQHDVKIHFYAPYPGTPLFEEACRAGFTPPQSLEEWAEYDYYTIETPWVKKEYEKIIYSFNANNCPYVHL